MVLKNTLKNFLIAAIFVSNIAISPIKANFFSKNISLATIKRSALFVAASSAILIAGYIAAIFVRAKSAGKVQNDILDQYQATKDNPTELSAEQKNTLINLEEEKAKGDWTKHLKRDTYFEQNNYKNLREKARKSFFLTDLIALVLPKRYNDSVKTLKNGAIINSLALFAMGKISRKPEYTELAVKLRVNAILIDKDGNYLASKKNSKQKKFFSFS